MKKRISKWMVPVATLVLLAVLVGCKKGGSSSKGPDPKTPGESGQKVVPPAPVQPVTPDPGTPAPLLPVSQAGFRYEIREAAGLKRPSDEVVAVPEKGQPALYPRANPNDPATARFVVWPDEFYGSRVDQSYFMVDGDRDSRTESEYDPVARVWFIKLESALGAKVSDLAGGKVRFDLDLLLKDGRKMKEKIELELRPVLPANTTEILKKPSPTVPADLVRSVIAGGLTAESRKISNPTSRRLKLWVRIDDSGPIRLEARTVFHAMAIDLWQHGRAEFPVTTVKVTRKGGVSEIKPGTGQWISFDLEPGEEIGVEFRGELNAVTPLCDRPDGTIEIGVANLVGTFKHSMVLSEAGEVADAPNVLHLPGVQWSYDVHLGSTPWEAREDCLMY